MMRTQIVHEAETALLSAVALDAQGRVLANHTNLIPSGMNLGNPGDCARDSNSYRQSAADNQR
jgi:hypothetical protein